MNNVNISIVIPVYNAEKYIKECIDSIVNQNYRDFEVICIDDGSNDNSYNIIKEYSKIDERIKIYKQKHSYAGTARNLGLKYAKGKYLLFMDADDLLVNNTLYKVVNKAEEDVADIVIYDISMFDCISKEEINDESEKSKHLLFDECNKKSESIYNIIFDFTHPWVWNKVFKKDFILENELEFMETIRCNDIYFTYISLVKAQKISLIDEKLIKYRVNNTNSLQGTNYKTPQNLITALRKIKDDLVKIEIYEKCRDSFINMCIENGYYLLRCIWNKTNEKEYQMLIQALSDEIGIINYEPNNNTKLVDYLELYIGCCLDYDKYYKYRIKQEAIEEGYYLFPFWQIDKNKDVLIYGAGKVGKDYYFQLRSINYCKNIFLTDTYYYNKDEDIIISPDEAFSKHIDYIVIAISDELVARKIEKYIKNRFSFPVVNIIHPLIVMKYK